MYNKYRGRDMNVTLLIAIIGCILGIISGVLGVVSFFLGRKDKGEKDTQNSAYKMGVIETKLDNISNQLKTLSDKFDKYEIEVDDKIEKAIISHEKQYHKKG